MAESEEKAVILDDLRRRLAEWMEKTGDSYPYAPVSLPENGKIVPAVSRSPLKRTFSGPWNPSEKYKFKK